MTLQLGIQSGRAAGLRPSAGAAPGAKCDPRAQGQSNPPLVPELQTRLRACLESASVGLFQQLTALKLELVWAPPLPLPAPDGRELVTALAAAWRVPPAPLLPTLTEAAWRRHLEAALRTGLRGHRFIHPAGTWHFWYPLSVRGLLLGLAHVRGPVGKPGRPGEGLPEPAPGGLARCRPPVENRLGFDQSIALLRLVLHDATMTILAEWPVATATLPVPRPAAGAEPALRSVVLVQRMLDRLQQDYAGPLTLKLLASELGMNAAYLSDLFHRQIGVSFKRYLTDRRLRQASELLRDPLRRISEVAFAVGYTDPNQFRRVFKTWSGQPPRAVQNGSGIAGATSDHQKTSSQTFAGFSKVMQLGITRDHAL